VVPDWTAWRPASQAGEELSPRRARMIRSREITQFACFAQDHPFERPQFA